MAAARGCRFTARFRSATKCRNRRPSRSPAAAVASATERTVADRFSDGTDYYNTGKMGDELGHGYSALTVTRELMERGQQRFNITCAMCHGATAAGNGITKQYGLATVVTLQDDRIRKMSDGEIFNTITNGKNTMMAYGPNIDGRRSLGDYCLLARAAAQPKRDVGDVPTHRRTGQTGDQSPRRRKMSERSEAFADAGRRIFREQALRRAFVLLGVIALVALRPVGRRRVTLSRSNLAFSWLFAFAFFFTLCAGCFFWTIVHHATDAEWSVVVRRQLENIAVAAC